MYNDAFLVKLHQECVISDMKIVQQFQLGFKLNEWKGNQFIYNHSDKVPSGAMTEWGFICWVMFLNYGQLTSS